jgi:ABC-type Na+ efflux pump permease subunit/membrane protease YdiL (CAAX protease family)
VTKSRGVLGTLFRHEVRMVLRDRRTLLIAVAAPLLLFPILTFVSSRVNRAEEARIEAQVYRWAVTGSRADWAADLTQRALDQELGESSLEFERIETERADSLLEAEELHVVVAGLEAEEWRHLQDSRGDTLDADDGAAATAPVLELRYRARSDFSRTAEDSLAQRLRQLREFDQVELYRTAGLAVDPDDVWPLEEENVASIERESSAVLGLALTPLLLFLMLSGGSIVAADTISGEKERGTLETLLTSAAGRQQIVRAKQLAIVALGLGVALINVANLSLYLVFGVFDLPEGFAVSIGVPELLLTLVLFVPLAVLVSSTLLWLSGVSKSYREYQIYFFPIFLIFLAPALASLLPGMDLRSAIAFVPIAGIGVGVRELMLGEIDLLFLALAFASTSAAAWIVSRRTEQALSTERLVTANDLDEADLVGGPALYPRHVLRWFLGMWVVFFIANVWGVGSLWIGWQVLINVVLIMFGGSLFIGRRYRIDPREMFNLRPPHWAVWLAVLIGVPSALYLGVGLSGLVNRFVFPISEEVLRDFGDSLIGEQDLALWQIVLFITIAPGIFEELTFRGALLHGLKRRLRPVPLVLAVGLIFGFFHVSLFRILPTAWLGMVLTAVTLMSGSIYPAMVWHTLNNALAIVPAWLGWVSADSTLPLWAYAVCAVGLGLSFRILWMVRRPVPNVRGATDGPLRPGRAMADPNPSEPGSRPATEGVA